MPRWVGMSVPCKDSDLVGGWFGSLAELMLIMMGLTHPSPDSGDSPFIHSCSQPTSQPLARSLSWPVLLHRAPTHFRLETRSSLMRVLCDLPLRFPIPHPPRPAPHFPTRQVPQGGLQKRARCHFVGRLFLTLFVCLTLVKRTDEIHL